jgi:hypothetical protein
VGDVSCGAAAVGCTPRRERALTTVREGLSERSFEITKAAATRHTAMATAPMMIVAVRMDRRRGYRNSRRYCACSFMDYHPVWFRLARSIAVMSNMAAVNPSKTAAVTP